MFNRRKDHEQEDRFNRTIQEMLHEARMSEAEIDGIAGASDLYERVQARIAAKQDAQRVAGSDRHGPARLRSFFLSEWLGSRPWPRLVFAVTFATLLLLALAIPRWLRTTPNAPQQVAILPQPSPTQTAFTGEDRTGRIAEANPDKQTALLRAAASGGSKRVTGRRNRAAEEIVTDFIPLTWVTEATAMDSGQVMRVRVPRTMLHSIGVATNAAGADEFVLADLVVSDDGLARAIRLVN